MTMLVTTFRILLGLFFDDGWLAIAIILIVLLSWFFFNFVARCAACRWRRAAYRVPRRAFRQCRESCAAIIPEVLEF